MKKTVCVIFVVCFLLSCSYTLPKEGGEEECPICFTIRYIEEVLPFPSVRSIPDNPIGEPSAGGSQENPKEEEQSPYTRLEYVVYKEGESVPFKHVSYTEGDDDFGIVYDRLAPGIYQIAFVAYQSGKGTLSAGHLLGFDEVSDTFYKLLSLTVEPGRETISDITLSRIVGGVEFVSTDAVPAEAARFELQIENYVSLLDCLSGSGRMATDTGRIVHPFVAAESGCTGLSHRFYTFIPALSESKQTRVRLATFSPSGEMIYSREVPVEVQQNKIVRYTGRLYTPEIMDDTFTIDVDTVWGERIDNELPD